TRDARYARKRRNQARRSNERASKPTGEPRSLVLILAAQNAEHVNLPIARLHEERWLQLDEVYESAFECPDSQYPQFRSSLRILSAVRSDNAAIVSVGLAVAPVGNVLLPTKYKLS